MAGGGHRVVARANHLRRLWHNMQDVHCPNAVGGSSHIHSNHVKCLPACHGQRTRMRSSVTLRMCSLHLHWQAVQLQLVSRSGGSPPPHQCYKILLRGFGFRALAFGRYMLKPGQVTSWPERVARRGRRRTFDTSHQVTQSVVSGKKYLCSLD